MTTFDIPKQASQWRIRCSLEEMSKSGACLILDFMNPLCGSYHLVASKHKKDQALDRPSQSSETNAYPTGLLYAWKQWPVGRDEIVCPAVFYEPILAGRTQSQSQPNGL